MREWRKRRDMSVYRRIPVPISIHKKRRKKDASGDFKGDLSRRKEGWRKEDIDSRLIKEESIEDRRKERRKEGRNQSRIDHHHI